MGSADDPKPLDAWTNWINLPVTQPEELKMQATELLTTASAEIFTAGILYDILELLLVPVMALKVATRDIPNELLDPADVLQHMKLSETQLELWQPVPPMEICMDVE